MAIEDDLTEAFIEGYRAAGEATGYWGRRFLQAVKRNGGLATAQRMLLPRNEAQRKGLDSLIEHNRPDLSVEAIVLQPRFQSLFTEDQLKIAKERLGEYGKQIAAVAKTREQLFPDELVPGPQYVEGARKQIRVNAYERDPKARKKCIEHFGPNCSVCDFNFKARYGEIGDGFIHVHHLRPLSLTDGAYALDPVNDLRPVCPNCHAMLHRRNPPWSIEELRARMSHTAL